MERLADDTIESFMNAIEERLAEGQKNKIPFSRFLEEKMDAFDYSNTSLAKKVFHRVEKKKEGTVSYVPVTRQAIGGMASWFHAIIQGYLCHTWYGI